MLMIHFDREVQHITLACNGRPHANMLALTVA